MMYAPVRDSERSKKSGFSQRPRSHSRAKSPAKPSSSGDSEKLVTYEYEGNKVWVALAPTMEEAIDRVFEVYPELDGCPRERIGFFVLAHVGDEVEQVQISSYAWKPLSGSLTKFEVLHVKLLASRPPSVVLNDPPPYHSSVMFAEEKEKDKHELLRPEGYTPRSRSHSTASRHSPSRPASPSASKPNILERTIQAISSKLQPE